MMPFHSRTRSQFAIVVQCAPISSPTSRVGTKNGLSRMIFCNSRQIAASIWAISLFPFGVFAITTRARAYAWNGFRIAGTINASKTKLGS